jgi:hypothetical protein
VIDTGPGKPVGFMRVYITGLGPGRKICILGKPVPVSYTRAYLTCRDQKFNETQTIPNLENTCTYRDHESEQMRGASISSHANLLAGT